MTTLAEDMLDDRSIFFDVEEMANTATWLSKNGITTGEFPCLAGDSILNGNEITGEVSDESSRISVMSDDSVVLQVKKNDFISITDINSNVVKYEVVNDPVIDSYKAGFSFIVLRRSQQTRI